MLKTMTVRTAIAAILAGLSMSAHAVADAPTRIDVPAGELVVALETLSRQAAVDLVFQPDQLRSFHTDGVSGTYSPQDAIRILLEGTPLQLRTDASSGAMVIAPPAAPKTSSLSRQWRGPEGEGSAFTGEERRSFWSRLRLSQSSPSRGEGQGEVTAAEGGAEPQPQKRAEVAEVVVTGTHIRGAENPTAPLIVMDRDFIDASGLTTTVQLMEALPQNFALVNQTATGGVFSGNSFSTLQGASINLRGMGEGTTLTLVNGRRMPLGYDGSAVNIVALPLSAVERVEVLTDGASALYGSDAVGGVVNFIFRKDFEGAESSALYGEADSIDENRLSQVFGRSWGSGNFVISAEHYARDMLRASDRSYVSNATLVGSLLPRDENLGATFFGRQTLAGIDLFVDALYTKRDTFNKSLEVSPTDDTSINIDNTQISVSTGLGWDLTPSWRAEISAGFGEDDVVSYGTNPLSELSGGPAQTRAPVVSRMYAFDLKADGPLIDLPAGPVRVAVGAHWREEDQETSQVGLTATGEVMPFQSFAFEKLRHVKSLFAEASVPLMDASEAWSMADRLTLSLAARYDEYSDFGSSVDPRIGIAWAPVETLKLRASWGTSYLAPKLRDHDLSLNLALAIDDEPTLGGLNVLAVSGNAPELLKAQEAENYTLGLDWAPAFLPGATLALNYYNIDYREKLETVVADLGLMLANPDIYGPLMIIGPTPEQVNDYMTKGNGGFGFLAFFPDFSPNPDFDPAAVDVIFDQRRRNIGVVKTKGVDVSAAYGFAAAGGDIHLGVDVAYVFEMLKQITPTSESTDVVDTYQNPTRLRLRASLGFTRGGWSFNGFVHRRNAYEDNRFAPFVGIDSHTTVDLNAAYRFDQVAGPLAGLSVRLAGTNVFDTNPPGVRVRGLGLYDLGFDPSNASALGRFVSFDLTKRW